MRLPTEFSRGLAALGLSIALTGCTLLGGGDTKSVATSGADPDLVAAATTGPAADYPMLLGDSFTIDGITYTPADTLNYDHVGYAGSEAAGGDAITISHRTLPVPSYVEITSLESGRTILARIERRGPMAGNRLAALSPGAMRQLGGKDGTPIRVRRVNPPEIQRAELRQGRAAPERMSTPKSLITALKRKLPEKGSASLRSAAADRTRAPQPVVQPPVQPVVKTASAVSKPAAELPPAKTVATMGLPPIESTPKTASAAAPAKKTPVAAVKPTPKPAPKPTPKPSPAKRSAAAYPLPPLEGIAPVAAAPKSPVAPRVAGFTLPPKQASTPAAKPSNRAPAKAASAASAPKTGFVIQAAAFANQQNAARAASTLGGFVSRAGRFYRVRTGPFTSRGQAEAALAKVRDAGYSDARVVTAG